MLIALLALAVFAGGDFARDPRGERRLLWEMKLSDHVRERLPLLGPKRHPVYALKFSPDGREVAVAFGRHFSGGVVNGHVLVVPLDPKQGEYRQFEAVWFGYPALVWSPDGKYLAVANGKVAYIITVAAGTHCSILQSSGGVRPAFLGDRLVMASAASGPLAAGAPTSDVQLFNADCHAVDSFRVRGKVVSIATESEKGWLALSVKGEGWAILDGKTRTKVALRPYRRDASRTLEFVDSGKALCEFDAHGPCGAVTLPVCTTIGADAEERKNHPSGQLMEPLDVSSAGSLIVITDRQCRTAAVSGIRTISSKRMVVFDYRTGREVLSWKPDLQEGSAPGVRDPFVTAISPTGKYLAESGDDILRLYALPDSDAKP